MSRLFDRWIIVFAGFFMVMATLTRAEEQKFPDARRLLIESIGGDSAVMKLKSIKAIETFGMGSANGSPNRFHTIIAPPDRTYFDFQHSGYSVGRILDGDKGWNKSLNGKYTRMSNTELLNAKRSLFVETFQYLFLDSQSQLLKVDAKSMNQDHPSWKVVLTVGDGYIIPFYVDAASKNLLAVEGYFDNVRVRMVNTEFDTISSIIFPTKTISKIGETGFEVVQEIDSILLRDSIDSALFRPVTGASLANFPHGAVEISVPIEYVNGHIQFNATINRKKTLRFILDTGASMNLLHKESITNLSIPTIGTFPIRSIGGALEIPLVRIDELEIGGLKLSPHAAGVTELPEIVGASISDKELGGLLGFDFLSETPVTIDIKKRRMTIHNPKYFVAPSGSAQIPFEFYFQLPILTGDFCGVKGPFLVDMGNAGGIILHQSFISQNKLDSCLKPFDYTTYFEPSIGSMITNRYFTARSMTFSGVRFDSLLVSVPDSSAGLAGTSDIAGNLGSAFFAPYEITFDYPNRVLYLRTLE